MQMLKAVLALAMLFPAAWAHADVHFETRPVASAKPPQASALDRLVQDVCSKEIVLLGEDARHASGGTVATKTEVVKRLVKECGFSAVFFEAQVYDFIALGEELVAGSASEAKLADAIGGIWSLAREIEPLLTFLFNEASFGRLTLRGLDPQVGGATQLFSQRDLPVRMTATLTGQRRDECEGELRSLTTWQYTASVPYDDSARSRLRSCLKDIEKALADTATSERARADRLMAANLGSYLDLSLGDDFNRRDRVMFENLEAQWHDLPKGTKRIVWCASVHAAKSLTDFRPGSRPLGAYVHERYGSRAKAVGFSALRGSTAKRGQAPEALPEAETDTLEARAFSAENSEPDVYLNRAQLDTFGVARGRALNYRSPHSARWGELFDGILVLREERPPQYVREPVPWQLLRQ